jgi:hypothetical protein
VLFNSGIEAYYKQMSGGGAPRLSGIDFLSAKCLIGSAEAVLQIAN